MRSLEEILAELNAAEKEYARKCREYGIEDRAAERSLRTLRTIRKKANKLPSFCIIIILYL